ncbi:hypothetical protein K435DRAFT_961029 [Dendrothele bispora CBS 962.96]|uniref:Uncharacterized protein n=1 Tax=Dendrothele bispora (strain CBS 962.96) TaxID=1314807 RepID=A0A4S8MR17_DENBC|nr:hypothetical protein K435DRAFT_961029 [Dendrothele bispora CBS 962.96]
MFSLDAFLTPPAPLGPNSSGLSPTEGSDCVAFNATSAALVVPTEECRLTMPDIAGEGPLHFNQNATQRMVLNLRDPGSATPNPRPKKLADTMAQYATTWGRTLQLKNGHQDELIRASQIKDPNLQFLYIAGLIFSLKDEFALVRPADTAVTVPEHTDGYIEKLTVRGILDPAASAYKTRPGEKAMQTLKKHPEWVPLALLEHKPTMKTIKTKVNGRFTHHRADIKDAISKSLGTFDALDQKFDGPFTPIMRLTATVITEVGGRSCEVKMTIPLVARIAFLRNMYVAEAIKTLDGKVGGHFWDVVDKGLQKIRDSQNCDAVKISQVFGRILDDDRVKYQDLEAGEENLDELAEVDVEVDYN